MIRRSKYIILFVLAALVMTGCTVNGPFYGNIVGEVRSSRTGAPIPGALVRIASKEESTGEDGRFEINNITAKAHKITIKHYYFQDFESSVTIPNGKAALYEEKDAFRLEPRQESPSYGSVEGYIYVRAGSQMSAASLEEMEPLFLAQANPPSGFEPVTNAIVSIHDRTSYTDRDGFFQVGGIEPGERSLRITSPSLRFDIERIVRVYAGQVTRFTGSSSLYGGIGYYIVIGIDKYPGEPVIPGSVDNALKVYSSLFDENRLAGLGELLINTNATKQKIKTAVNKAVNMATSEYDYLVIYFSGLSGKDFISPSDDPGDHWSTAITDTELEEWVRPFKGSVTLIIDGRESNSMADGEVFKPQAFKKPYYTVISAAGPNQGVFYDPNLKSSVFTHFLVKGLSGTYPADLYRDGDITAYELFQYVYVEMDDYLWGDPERHLPTYWGPDYRDSVIFRY